MLKMPKGRQRTEITGGYWGHGEKINAEKAENAEDAEERGIDKKYRGDKKKINAEKAENAEDAEEKNEIKKVQRRRKEFKCGEHWERRKRRSDIDKDNTEETERI